MKEKTWESWTIGSSQIPWLMPCRLLIVVAFTYSKPSLDTPRQGLVRDPRLYLIGWMSNYTNEQPRNVPVKYTKSVMRDEYQNM